MANHDHSHLEETAVHDHHGHGHDDHHDDHHGDKYQSNFITHYIFSQDHKLKFLLIQKYIEAINKTNFGLGRIHILTRMSPSFSEKPDTQVTVSLRVAKSKTL